MRGKQDDKKGAMITDFLSHMQAVKPSAFKLYTSMLRGYAAWLDKSVEALTPDDFRKALIERYIAEELSTKSPYSVNAFVAAIRSFSSYITDNYYYDDRLLRFAMSLRSLKYEEVGRPMKLEALSVEELEMLLAKIDNPFLYSATLVHFYFGARPVELAARFKEKKIDLKDVDGFVKEHGFWVVDYSQQLVLIKTAKSKRRYRIIPLHDSIVEHFRVWNNGIERVLNYCRPNEWFTNNIWLSAQKAGLNVTAKTARKTFETLMTERKLDIRIARYWLGHKGGIEEVYTDYVQLLDHIKAEVFPRHHVIEILGRA